jgi:hypothetical protein
VVAVREAFARLAQGSRPNWRDALRFAPDLTQSRLSKFMPCVPDDLARELVVEKLVDITNARRMLGLPPLSPDERDVPVAAATRRPIIWVREASELLALGRSLLSEPFVALGCRDDADGPPAVPGAARDAHGDLPRGSAGRGRP